MYTVWTFGYLNVTGVSEENLCMRLNGCRMKFVQQSIYV